MQIKFTDSSANEFMVRLEESEIQYLVEYALIDLIRKGILAVDLNDENEASLRLLGDMPIEDMPQA